MHGPEMEYFEEGRNGLMTSPDSAAYAEAVTLLLSDPKELQRLREGAANSAEKYSMEAMVENFRRGNRAVPGAAKMAGKPVQVAQGAERAVKREGFGNLLVWEMKS